MGMLINGIWHPQDNEIENGAFIREETAFRHWISADGASGPNGEPGFAAESGRYQLYVSYACPWAHRALLYRQLKGLTAHIGLSIVSPYLDNTQGWHFDPQTDGSAADPVTGARYLRELYLTARPDMTGRVSVPVLWDKARNTIVSNESAEIIRMFDTAFTRITGRAPAYRPAELTEAIDAINDRVYETVNNGVYKAGFATSQKAYDAAVTALFESLDWLEGILSRQRYLLGDRITEADWRLFTTGIRFDHVYHGLFKCNRRQWQEYPHLSGWLRDLYQKPGIAETVRFNHIMPHYWWSLNWINPTRIVPLGPALGFDSPLGLTE